MALFQVFLFGFLWTIHTVSGGTVEVSLCDEISSPVVTFSYLNIRPIPVKLGSPVSIELTVHKQIETKPGTRVEISASFFIFTFECPKHEPFCIDVCDTLAKNSSTCAKLDGQKCGNCVLPPGDYKVFYDVPTPNVPMKGEGSIKVKVLDKSDTLLACVEGKVDFE